MALFSYGSRPFFLLVGLWAAVGLPNSIAAIFGWLDLPTTMAPGNWHAHELLFGYATTVVAGFLLTTVPNWTGRLLLRGWGLAALVAVTLREIVAGKNWRNLPAIAALRCWSWRTPSITP